MGRIRHLSDRVWDWAVVDAWAETSVRCLLGLEEALKHGRAGPHPVRNSIILIDFIGPEQTPGRFPDRSRRSVTPPNLSHRGRCAVWLFRHHARSYLLRSRGSFIFGIFASTALSLYVVAVVYFLLKNRKTAQ
ncbi:protein of unknown function [Methylocaldum szegediense]|uniref:Uncharacterized protein n=1 Tax=Methylocaldum szegediense TaxID=73780 RepID=A0ABM9I5W4_9GAMM|nr:protein of unknown function [Methylocaldum szegediense]